LVDYVEPLAYVSRICRLKGDPMQSERHVRLFRNGRNQAVRIPREFEMDGNEAIIRKEGNRLILEPIGINNRLLKLLKTLEPIKDEFPEIEDPSLDDEEIF
jgi:antitoxin VapB